MHHNKVQSRQHRIYVVHPTLGLRPPTLLYYHWPIGYKNKALETLTPHRTEDLRSSLDPSSFPYNTKPSISSHRDLR
jgi:hypothetical protein